MSPLFTVYVLDEAVDPLFALLLGFDVLGFDVLGLEALGLLVDGLLAEALLLEDALPSILIFWPTLI